MQKKRNYLKIIKNTIISLLILIAIVGIITGLIFMFAEHTGNKQRNNAINLVEKNANFHNVNHVYKANVEKTYYTVSGKNSDDVNAFALVSSNMHHIQVMKQSDGISANKAKQIASNNFPNYKVTNLGLEKVDNKSVWAVSLSNNKKQMKYVFINFKNGHVIKKFNNI